MQLLLKRKEILSERKKKKEKEERKRKKREREKGAVVLKA